jgi:hypothetical protein
MAGGTPGRCRDRGREVDDKFNSPSADQGSSSALIKLLLGLPEKKGKGRQR